MNKRELNETIEQLKHELEMLKIENRGYKQREEIDKKYNEKNIARDYKYVLFIENNNFIKAKIYYYGTEIKNVKSFSVDYSGIDINTN